MSYSHTLPRVLQLKHLHFLEVKILHIDLWLVLTILIAQFFKFQFFPLPLHFVKILEEKSVKNWKQKCDCSSNQLSFFLFFSTPWLYIYTPIEGQSTRRKKVTRYKQKKSSTKKNEKWKTQWIQKFRVWQGIRIKREKTKWLDSGIKRSKVWRIMYDRFYLPATWHLNIKNHHFVKVSIYFIYHFIFH